MKTAIYIRVSTNEQAKEGYSLAAQKRKLVSYCMARDWVVTQIYTDEGISADTIDARPEALRMLEDSKHGIFENILILKVDRLCRNVKELLQLVDDLKPNKIRLNAVEEQIDPSTPVGRMMLTMLGGFAELEKSTIASRMKSGREQKVRNGLKSKTGKILYGYDYVDGKYIPNPEQEKIVKVIYEKILDGCSIRSLARYLNENKIPTSNNTYWSAMYIRRLLGNPTYKGYTFHSLYNTRDSYYNYNSELTTMNKATNIVPIIDEHTFDKVNSIIESRKGTNTRKYALDDFYFADVAYCASCGWKLYSKNATAGLNLGGKRRLYYRCYYNNHHFTNIENSDSKCNFGAIENSKLEKLFLAYFDNVNLNNGNIIDTNNAIDNSDEVLIENLNAKKIKLAKRKENLLEKYLDEKVTDEEYSLMTNNIATELNDIAEKLKVLDEQKNIASSYDDEVKLKELLLETKNIINDTWALMTDSNKRFFVTSIIEKMYVAKNKIVKIIFK